MSARVLRTLSLSVLAGFITALLGVASVGPTAGALATNTIGIAPVGETDNFHLSVLPGETTEREAVVTNLTNEAHHVRVYPVDAAVTAQGGFALAERDASPTGAGAWTRLPVSELTLAPHSKTPLRFTVSVPANAVPGDYAGGIVIETDPAGRPQDLGNSFAVQMNLIERIGVRLYLNVAGEAIRTLQAGQLTWQRTQAGIRFHLPVTNTGNMRLNPHGRLTLTGLGMPADLDMSHVETLLPGSTVTLTALWAKPPILANGTATATITFDGGPAQQRSTHVRLLPLLLTAATLAALAGILLITWRFVRFLRKARHALRLAGQPSETTGSKTQPATEAAGPYRLRRHERRALAKR
jgi:hypothetical protein